MSGPKNALAIWHEAGLRYVELPSGTKALVRLPDVVELIRRNLLPEQLRALAVKYANDGIVVGKLDGDDLLKFVDFTYELVARMLKYLAPADSEATKPGDEGWLPLTLTAGELREGDVDPADIEALATIAGRQKTTNEVTLISRFDRGMLTEEALTIVRAEQARTAEAAREADAGDRVSDHATFPRQPGRALSRADGEDVREAADGVLPRPGSGRRVRRR